MVNPSARRASKWSMLLTLGFALFAALLSACSEDTNPIDDQPRVAPSDTRPSSIGRQAGEPSVGRSSGEPEPPGPPLLHVLGSVQSIGDSTPLLSFENSIFTNDLATIASLGCSSTACSPNELATWADGQVEIMSAATLRAAIEGPGSLLAQVDALNAAGVLVVGYGSDIDRASDAVVIGARDQKIAIYAISLAPDTQSLATEDRAGVAGPAALDRVREGVIRSRNDGLGVVVLVDWGNLVDRSPTPQQVADVERLVEAGADAIVGHGVDYLQRFDLVGQSAVAYSLGNASIVTGDPLLADTAVLRLEFDSPGRSCLLPATATASGPTLDNPNLTSCG